ncbi:MAG: hypothetical protein UW06_C0020G0002 [Parcubacteria group bacterium GW2011_GWE1_43_8]|nr:MAG: hypothetical protein UW06_C0020G0002 [Parcubacteria group bacterium GW2011_GWE1_43_8]
MVVLIINIIALVLSIWAAVIAPHRWPFSRDIEYEKEKKHYNILQLLLGIIVLLIIGTIIAGMLTYAD